MRKRLFAVLLCLCMLTGLLPATALAAEPAGGLQAVPSQTRTVGKWEFNDTSDSSGNGNTLTTDGAIFFEGGWMKTQEGQVGNASVDLELNGGAGFSLSMAFSTIRAAGTGAGAQTELFTLGSLSAVAYTTGELEVSLDKQSVGSAVGTVSDSGTNTLEVRIETDNALHVILNGSEIGYIADADVGGKKKLVIGNWSQFGYATSFDYVRITDTQPQPTGYTVTFDGNGGSGTMANQSFDYDEEKALAANSFTRTGHDFTGWNTKADGSGTSYTDEQEVKNLTDTDGGTVTLYAQWKPSTYAVALHPNEGTIATGKAVTQYTYGTGAALPTAEDITRDGYAFKGWYEDSSFSGSPVAKITAADTGAKTYYAKWMKLWTVTVTAGDGGTVSGGGTFEESSTVTVTAVPDSGYRFFRWTENGAQVSTDESYAFPLTGDRNLTAEFARNSSGSSSYTITTPDAEHGTVAASPSRASSGTTVTITVTPDEGYELGELIVTDTNGDEVDLTRESATKYTFEMPRSRVTVAASFVESAPEPLPFDDVDDGDWFADAVRYVYENGMMNGTGDTTFAPDDTTSRSMIVTILYRLEGEPVVDDAMDFTDVAGDAWYTDAVRWAAGEGIVGGYGGGLFGSDDAVTREQLAAILYRYAVYKGYDVSIGEDTNLLSYTDFADLSEYAIPAMQWACGAGIVNGTSESTLTPQGEATRAQVAAMLMRFCEQYVETLDISDRIL